jgi:phosphohistidine phosphatase
MKDFDRPLDETGIADAQATGEAMRACAYVPDLTLCSTARRTRETLEEIAGSADTGRVIFLDVLYSDDAGGYLEQIRRNGSAGSVLVIGHNPMMEDLAIAVSHDGEENALAMLHQGFPTCGLAVVRFEQNLAQAAPGGGYLEAFLSPMRR